MAGLLTGLEWLRHGELERRPEEASGRPLSVCCGVEGWSGDKRVVVVVMM